MTIAERSHLFPSRTQKLSSLALMILGGTLPGKVGRCRFLKERTIQRVVLLLCVEQDPEDSDEIDNAASTLQNEDDRWNRIDIYDYSDVVTF